VHSIEEEVIDGEWHLLHARMGSIWMKQDAESVRQCKTTVVWSIWLIWFVLYRCLNQTNQMNQINRTCHAASFERGLANWDRGTRSLSSPWLERGYTLGKGPSVDFLHLGHDIFDRFGH
jgi:hypothetical protein